MTAPFKLMSIQDIVEAAAGEASKSRARRQWGRWHLEVETLELVFRDGQRTLYRIDLERCATAAQVLDWLFQLRAKSWTTPSDIGHLADAFRDILDPQANLCSWAIAKTMDAKTHLRRRYGGGARA
jgi:hypothetical protein